MNAAERHTTKLLIDRARREKINAEGRKAVRPYRRTQHVEAVNTVFPTEPKSFRRV